jgi:hypothetical protein
MRRGANSIGLKHLELIDDFEVMQFALTDSFRTDRRRTK